MNRIYKYILPSAAGCVTMPLPKRSRIVHFAEQHGKACFWAQVFTEETEPKEFLLAHTGDDVPGDFTYVGTIVLQAGYYVLHLFEKVNI